MRRVVMWALMLGVVFGIGLQGLCEQGKPIPSGQVIPTIETSLQQLAAEAQRAVSQAEELAFQLGIDWEDGRVCVVIETDGSLSASAVACLGGEVLLRADAFHLLKVEISAARVMELACLPGVKYVRTPYRPVPLILSEGVELSGALTWQHEGYSGQGIRVAVIDGGFEGLAAALSAGELAHVVFTRDYTGDGLETGGVHGTACAEIVHDMAPAAELLLMKIGGGVSFANAVSDAISQGADVITHSMGWFNTNFYDGTGIIAEIVAQAVNSGILWVNAAGNSANGGHWEGDWQDADMDEWLDFAPLDEENTLYLEAGQMIGLLFTWDAWPATDQDYDLYLVDESGNIVAGSTSYQNGTQAPTEVIFYIAPIAGNYGIKVVVWDAPDHPRMELFCLYYGLPVEYDTAVSTITAPGNASFVLTVGAIDWRNWETGPQESFSSQGPTNNSRHAASIIKPDICGADGVSGMSYGSSFYGTSASSPQVAGAAALVWSRYPSWGATDVRDWLESNAVDMGTWGKDNIYGYGRLHMPLPHEPPFDEQCCYLEAGWNLISPPLDPDNPDPTVVFDEVTGDLYLCAYDAATGWLWAGDVPTGFSGQGNALVEVDPMGAYYLWLPEVPGGLSVCVTGTPVEGDQAIQLGDAGWYTFGVPYEVNWDDSGQISVTRNGDTLTLAEAAVADWIWDEVYEYDAEAGEWIVTSVVDGTLLVPCLGYWFYTYEDDLVIGFSEEAPVGPPGPPPTPSAIKSAHLKSPGNPPMPMPPPPKTFDPSKLEFGNYPNPVRNVHTTTFAVKGIMATFVDAIKVQIFDLSGQKVYEEEMAGTSIDWHTDNDYGEYLANGVYLYKLYAKVDGQWVVSEVKKLAILR